VGKQANDIRRVTHRTIAAVTEDLEKFRFNKAVARVFEFINALSTFEPKDAGDQWVMREALEALTMLINPMVPHLSEECWQKLGSTTMAVHAPWPKADPELTRLDSVTLAIQIDGKRRDEVELPKDLPSKAVEEAALAREDVRKAIDGRAIKKVIIVPNRIVNIVTEPK
jgi:leucyl-tRNA synthetase